MAEIRADSLCGILCKWDRLALPLILGAGVGGFGAFSFAFHPAIAGVGSVASGSAGSVSVSSSPVSDCWPPASSASRSSALVYSASMALLLFIASFMACISLALASALSVVTTVSRRSVNNATSVILPSNSNALILCAGAVSSLMACLVSSWMVKALMCAGV